MKETFLDKKTSNCIKGISAIFIMLGHICGSLPMPVRFLFSGEMWVGVFFFYSGYGLIKSYKNRGEDYLKGFIKKKIINIWIPFLIAESFYTISYCIKNGGLTATDIILGCLGIKLYNSVLWYVIELLAINLLFYLLYKFCRIKNKEIIWPVLYLIFLALSVILDIGTWWYISTSAFVMGILWDKIKRFLRTYEQSKALQIILITAFTMLYIVYKYLSLVSDAESIAGLPKNYILTGLALIMVPVFVLVIATITGYCKWTVNSASDNLGKISYEIYLYHGLIAMLLVTGISNEQLKVLLIVAVTLITAFVMNLLHRRLKALCGK